MPNVYTYYARDDAKRQKGIPAARKVKNLGWILRHASEVHTVGTYGFADYVEFVAIGMYAGTSLTFSYITQFADLKLARAFMKRPCFKHARLEDHLSFLP